MLNLLLAISSFQENPYIIKYLRMLTDIHSCLTDLKATAMLLEETEMLLDGKYLKRIPSSGNKTQITVLSCANAVGAIFHS